MKGSSLVEVRVQAHSSNYTKGRGKKIRCFTLHHVAGVMPAEAIGSIFARSGRNGSSHYGIGDDGKVGQYVSEDDTAWTNSNWASNQESITVEVSNSEVGGDWKVSDAAYNKLIELAADVSKRNGLGKYVKGKNFTWHQMFAATSCPGNYLLSRIDDIIAKANAIIEPAPTPTPTPTPTTGFKRGDKVIPTKWVDYNGTSLKKTRDFYFIGEIEGNRAVLHADSVDGATYAAMHTDNIKKVEDAPAPAPTPAPSTGFLPSKGYWAKGDNDVRVGQLAGFMRQCFPAYTSSKALGNYYGQYLTASVKEFQRRTGLEQDGCVGKITYAKLKEYGFSA